MALAASCCGFSVGAHRGASQRSRHRLIVESPPLGAELLLRETCIDQVASRWRRRARTMPRPTQEPKPCSTPASANRSTSPNKPGLKFPEKPVFATHAEERRHRQERLVAACRAFALHGLDYGFAGHLTVRDPERPHLYWTNPMAVHFSQVKCSNLILADHSGQVVEGRVRDQPRRLRAARRGPRAPRGHRRDVPCAHRLWRRLCVARPAAAADHAGRGLLLRGPCRDRRRRRQGRGRDRRRPQGRRWRSKASRPRSTRTTA